MRILLVSAYELGHQPLQVASPAAALRSAGHEVRALDLAVDEWAPDGLAWPDAVAFSVPMHTAMRVAVVAAEATRRERPDMPICFYGLYGEMAPTIQPVNSMDRVIAGEFEPTLVSWVTDLGRTSEPSNGSKEIVHLGRHPYHVPMRDVLPPLSRYARLAVGGEEKLVGYVEASHGCAHKCRHCPVPVVYDGRIRVVGAETVLGDIERLVDLGARHITFGDPDFLNGWRHSRGVVRVMHDHFPELTFDCTTKVEHILEHRHVWPEFADAGCLFVVSAFESMNDAVLGRLEKGHLAVEAAQTVDLLRMYGIETRPSWLPFTPWTTFEDVLDILDFVADQDLVGNVDPVQYSIRLLLPKGSLLVDQPDMQGHLGEYDEHRLSYTWQAAEVAVDLLQQQVADLVAAQFEAGMGIAESYGAVRMLVLEAAGPAAEGRVREFEIDAESAAARPRLTEPWFCCAEPSEAQFMQIAGA